MGEEEPIELGAAENLALSVGVAITEWGKVESELFILYLALCKAGVPPNPSSTIWETVVHIDLKLNIISALVEHRFPENEHLARAEWAKLDSHLRKRIKGARNKLAHWRIWKNEDGDDYFLGPQLTNPERQRSEFGKPSGGAMRADDIYEHALRFAELGDRVHAFIEDHLLPTSQDTTRG